MRYRVPVEGLSHKILQQNTREMAPGFCRVAKRMQPTPVEFARPNDRMADSSAIDNDLLWLDGIPPDELVPGFLRLWDEEDDSQIDLGTRKANVREISTALEQAISGLAGGVGRQELSETIVVPLGFDIVIDHQDAVVLFPLHAMLSSVCSRKDAR